MYVYYINNNITFDKQANDIFFLVVHYWHSLLWVSF